MPRVLKTKLQNPKIAGKIQLILGLFLIALTLGCASQKGLVSETDYLSLLPEEAEIYLRFPVTENQDLANGLVSSLIPYMEEKDVKNLIGRFTTIYGAVKNKEFSALASGSFPKAGLGFVLTEKNGWKKIQDKSIPITGIYYRYSGLQSSKGKPYQIAFPSSSMVMVASEVKPLLTSLYNQQEGIPSQSGISQNGTQEIPSDSNPLAEFTSSHVDNTSALTFYVADVTATVAPLLKTALAINLPVKDMFGEFFPVDLSQIQGENSTRPQEQLYLFTGYLGLADPRAMRPAQVALNILFRTLGLGTGESLTVSTQGEDTIVISGIVVSSSGLVSLLENLIK